ncbi:MAG TPA: molybdopterin-dependent oxidoreductase [Candidatus Dormibacteraeota bacterium]|nr:molybdopterin-dependent oxidoreductase [Candidatus Dormibacteraeota bacterium]
MTHDGWKRGAVAGIIGGLAAVAAMYVASLLTGLRALPDLLQQPVLALMPGPVFGFLIDNLQHAGKVIEEAGLVVAMVAALGALGAVAGVVATRTGLSRAGLVAAAAGWLVVALVVLPLAGRGLLGLADGVTTPVVWALVFVAYWLAWDAAWARGEKPFDADRRRLVAAVPAVIGLSSLAVIGVLKVPGWVRAIVAPPESGLTGPVPALTPVQNFYRVSKNFEDPVVSANGWSLRVTGLVQRQLSLSYRDLRAIPAVTQLMTLECISNDVGGELMSTGRFAGVPLRDLLTMAGPHGGAGAVNFHARDGYTESLPLATVMAAPDILVVHELDGAPLPDAHGFPARMLVPGHYGMKGPKWLEQVDVAQSEGGGFWEEQGWEAGAAVRTTSRFDTPTDGAVLRLGTVTVAGVAFSGNRGIQSVEWSADGGRTWGPAELQPPLGPLTWVLWTAAWHPAGEGEHTLVVRASDGGGAVQSADQAPSFPSGASGYHRIRVSVGR